MSAIDNLLEEYHAIDLRYAEIQQQRQQKRDEIFNALTNMGQEKYRNSDYSVAKTSDSTAQRISKTDFFSALDGANLDDGQRDYLIEHSLAEQSRCGTVVINCIRCS